MKKVEVDDGIARFLQAFESMSKPFPDGLTLGEHLVAGAVATGASVFAMHPMDTIKTFIQKTRVVDGIEVVKKLNILSASAELVKESGPLGFYKGVGPNVFGQAPAGAVKFAAFEGLSIWADRKLFETKKLGTNLKPLVDLGCAAIAFCVCSVVLVPGEVIKQRLQAGIYSGSREALRSIWTAEGARGFYTGFSATLARDVPYTMLEFGLYHQFKRALRWIINKDKLSSQEELMMGGLAGGFTGFVTTPLDVAKTRIMTQAAGSSHRYKNFLEAMIDITRKEGFAANFRGSSARVLWLVPFTAIYFGVHEKSKRMLLKRKGHVISHQIVRSKRVQQANC
uniref:Mitochondrial carrier protein n=1 Tax=Rhodosorus marinus TaxID=101924 RepID=A0A7S3ABY8_9RHOD|mmetsp:Transcript_7807/g.34778  ORF Transcript_7807/g.34778 Transcript_7807/m.34778 type:complete len:339 (+) Transcript_7807:94-1110(+)